MYMYSFVATTFRVNPIKCMTSYISDDLMCTSFEVFLGNILFLLYIRSDIWSWIQPNGTIVSIVFHPNCLHLEF